MHELVPLSLYIHFPWCERKCPYCDFNSHESQHIPQQQYVQSLLADLQQSLELIRNRTIHSIFFGGGTPSLLTTDSLNTILKGINQYVDVDSKAEVTLEANPGSAERDKFYHYRQSGVNRLSLGVQSFNDKKLQVLGRIHHADDAKQAVTKAQQAGFDNINIDLMEGLPNQLTSDVMRDINCALTLEIQHISWYELTIEPNTAFYSNPPILPIENELDKMETQGRQQLINNGFNRYEISAYALFSDRNHQCKHNLNYWQYGDYLGIGAGAHSKISTINPRGELEIMRFSKRKQPQGYMQLQQQVAVKSVAKSERLSDYLLNALRLVEGFSITQCMQRTDLSTASLQSSFEQLQNQGFVSIEGDWVIPTEQGLCFQNEAIMSL